MINKLFNNFVRILSIVFIGILLVLMFLSSFIGYYGKETLLLPNYLIFILIFLVFICLFYLYKKNKIRFNFNIDKAVKIISGILLIYQLALALSIYFIPGWDPGGLLDESMNRGFYRTYHSKYPNNLLLLFFEIFLCRLNEFLKVFDGDMLTKYIPFVVINVFINNITCILTYKCTNLYLNKKYAFISYLLAIMLFGISPWTIVFYSDSVGLLFPLLTFYFYSKFKKTEKPFVYILLFIFSGLIGYFIKPQCFIIVIAIGIYEIYHCLISKNKKYILKVFLCILLIFSMMFSIKKGLYILASFANAPLNAEAEFGPAHFFMMGLNANSGGGYSQDDVNFSQTFATKSERNKANIEVAISRIEEMGFMGLLKHTINKLLGVFNDGVFGWRFEGEFIRYAKDTSSTISTFFKNIYYDGEGIFDYFVLFEQFAWLMVISLTFCSCLSKKDNDCKFILLLSIIGLIMFETLFERGSRYVFTYLPIFCVLAGFGINHVKTIKI